MTPLLEEILEILDKAELCYEKNRNIKLPLNVSYLGMGASYNAAVTLSYCENKILPCTSSEYHYYIAKGVSSLAVLISQSGESSETLWNLEYFDHIIAITNHSESSLAKSHKTQTTIELHAGEEQSSSTKTYVNTLITLYLGLGVDPKKGIVQLRANFSSFQQEAMQHAQEISDYSNSNQTKGLYILGSGPNSATANQGALTMSEVTKLAWLGMPVAQYDHGPKETADNSVVIILNSSGRDRKRIEVLKQNLKKHSNALIVELVETQLVEPLSPLTLIVQLNFLMNYLADYMQIKDTFHIGSKVTTVPDSVK